MNTFHKICMIFALILLGAGLVFTIAGCAMGGAEKVSEIVDEVTGGDVAIGLNPSGEFFGLSVGDFSTDDVKNTVMGILDSKLYDVDDYGTIYNDSQKTMQGNVEKYVITAEKVEKLRVNVGGCEFSIKNSDDENFWVEAQNVSKLQAYVQGDELRLTSSSKGKITGANIKKVKITLYVPEDLVFDEARIELGAGIVRADDLAADKIELKVGAGEVVFETLNANKLDLEVGAGSVKLGDAAIGKLDCQVGAGNIEIWGTLDGDAKAKCAMGNITLKLANQYDDFDYKIECAAGNVSLGNQKFSGLAKDQKIDNDAEHELKLECSMGNIAVSFEE